MLSLSSLYWSLTKILQTLNPGGYKKIICDYYYFITACNNKPVEVTIYGSFADKGLRTHFLAQFTAKFSSLTKREGKRATVRTRCETVLSRHELWHHRIETGKGAAVALVRQSHLKQNLAVHGGWWGWKVGHLVAIGVPTVENNMHRKKREQLIPV